MTIFQLYWNNSRSHDKNVNKYEHNQVISMSRGPKLINFYVGKVRPISFQVESELQNPRKHNIWNMKSPKKPFIHLVDHICWHCCIWLDHFLVFGPNRWDLVTEYDSSKIYMVLAQHKIVWRNVYISFYFFLFCQRCEFHIKYEKGL